MPFGDYTEENNFGELTGCEANTEGPKSVGRPAEFCDTVAMASTLDVTGKTTLNETEVVPPEITVGGVTFVPAVATILVATGVDSNGDLITEWKQVTLLTSPSL